MTDSATTRNQLDTDGYAIREGIFNAEAISSILKRIDAAGRERESFRKTKDLFAIRRFLQEIPEAAAEIFIPPLQAALNDIGGEGYFTVKSIYFDKPPDSNWFVSFHQDLTIAVDRKIPVPGFGPWTVKQDQYAVQPPAAILQDNITARIHLDDTTGENGALKVIPGSHLHGIVRPETADLSNPVTCLAPAGAVLFMKPLLLHASSRTLNLQRRRVIHIEFSRQSLPAGLHWAEKTGLDLQ